MVVVKARMLLVVLAMLAAACGGGGVESGGTGTEGDAAAVEESAAAEGTAEAGGAAAEGEPIVIGMATSLSGSIALFGEANRNGAQLAVDELNEAGGVLGRPLELIVRDDQAQPEEGVSIARDLIIDDGVSALLGPVSSGVALAISEVAEERKVPFLLHTSNSEA